MLGVWIAGHRRRVYEGRESGEKDGYMKTDEHLSSKITFFCENVSRAGGFFRPSGSRRGGGTVSGAGLREGEARKPRRQSLWNRETAVAVCRHSGLKRRQAETD